MDSKKLQFERRGLLPGYAEGRFEAAPAYDPSEFTRTQLEDPLRRDNRVNIRVSGHDMTELHRIALAEGLPLQSLLAQVVHQYANGQLQKIDATPVLQQEEAGTSTDRPEP
ncbi:MAG: hypothetical protein SV422_08045 [Pseudomonadota bacterium]|nr:hypothetical protein [Pseudomonadota bacterium]